MLVGLSKSKTLEQCFSTKSRGIFLGTLIFDVRDNYSKHFRFSAYQKKYFRFTFFVFKIADRCTTFPFLVMKIAHIPFSANYDSLPPN